MTLQQVELDLSADVDGDGSKESATFTFAAGDGFQVTEGIESQMSTGPNSRGIIQTAANAIQPDGREKNKTIAFDLGTGLHFVQVQAKNWDGSTHTWGDGTGTLPTDATGESPLTQLHVLMQYLIVGTYDSRNPATLKYGERDNTSSTEFRPLAVVPWQPEITHTAGEPSHISVKMRFYAVFDKSSTNTFSAGDNTDSNGYGGGPGGYLDATLRRTH